MVRRTGAWLRQRSNIVVGREKRARRTSIHVAQSWARPGPVGSSMPGVKGRMAHNLRLAPGKKHERPTPVSFETHPVGTCPHGRRLSLSAILVERLHAPQSPVDWIPEPVSHQHSSTDQHRSAFTRGTDVPRNCLTLFCFQCTVSLFLHRSQKVEMLPARVETKRETFLPAGVRNPAACGGFSVR
jgi:hypothetical protein